MKGVLKKYCTQVDLVFGRRSLKGATELSLINLFAKYYQDYRSLNRGWQIREKLSKRSKSKLVGSPIVSEVKGSEIQAFIDSFS